MTTNNVRVVYRQNRPSSLVDSAVVFLSSLLLASPVLVPASVAVFKLSSILLRRRTQNSAPSPPSPPTTSDPASSYRRRRLRHLAAVATALLLSYCYVTVLRRRPPPSALQWFKRHPLLDSWRRYFSFSVLDASLSPPLPPSQQRVIAVAPHGLVPYSACLLSATSLPPHSCSAAVPSSRLVVAPATSLLPPLGLLLRYLASVPADLASVAGALEDGDNVTLCPGGIAGMFDCDPCGPDEEVCVLRRRKGFLRLCVRRGLPCVPVWCFGLSSTMRSVRLPLLPWLSRVLQASLLPLFGRFLLPIPFQEPLQCVVGTPIAPPIDVQDIDEATDIMHGMFCDEMRRIFDENKEAFGWGKKQLRIV